MSEIQEKIKELLKPLNLEVFDFQDDSHLHAGHAGNTGGGHFRLLLVSQDFDSLNRVARQRKVQDLLVELFENREIHALSIVAKTPNEYFH